jgi:hypothetical protein
MQKIIDIELEKHERRPAPRKRVLLTGLIVYGHGAFTCDCKFRNLSAGGARIILECAVALPARFHLINVRDGVAHETRLVWKKGLELGVKLESTLSLSAKPDHFAERLKKLWLAKAAR